MRTLTNGERRHRYRQRARRAIERGDTVAYDVAAEHGQILGNVRHMRWFEEAVAQELGGDDWPEKR